MTNPQYRAELLYSGGTMNVEPHPIASTQWDSYYGTKEWLVMQLTGKRFDFKKAGAEGFSRIGLARARSNGLGEFTVVTVPDMSLVIYYREKPTETNNRIDHSPARQFTEQLALRHPEQD